MVYEINERYCFVLRKAYKVMYKRSVKFTAVQYSCIGCVNLWFFAFLPEKKQFWHMSKLKHFKQRYLYRIF